MAFSALPVFGQDPNNLAVDGTIKDESGARLSGAVVTLYRDGVELNKVTTGNNGRFDLYLDFGYEFIVEISKASYVTKRLYFNTGNVPEDEQMWGYEYGGFLVDMIKRMDGVDYSILDQPIGKVYYEANVENFVNDRVYTKEIKAEVDRLEQAQKDAVKAEQERLKRIEEDYKLAISDAQRAMADGDYLTAQDNLIAAQGMKPQAQEPAQLLAQVEAKLNAAGQEDERYLTILTSADQAFGNENFDEAIKLYNDALVVKPTESYPKERIAESQKLLDAKKAAEREAEALAEKDKAYNDAIAKADAAYTKGAWRDAKALYQNALAHKDDPHPKKRIAEIDIKLEENALAQKELENAARLEAEFKMKVDKGLAALSAENFDMAKGHFSEALAIKSDEDVRQKLAFIEQKLEEQVAQNLAAEEAKRVNAAYVQKILEADKAFNQRNFEDAKPIYKAALALKGGEVYPKQQIEKIEKELGALADAERRKQEQLRVDQEFAALVNEGDKSFSGKNFNNALSQYESALALKDNQDVKNKIAATKDALARLAKSQEAQMRYEKTIAEADEMFDNKAFEKAMETYNLAAGMMPNEAYPKERMKAIETILAKQKQETAAAEQEKERQENFERLISEAEGLLKADNLDGAEAAARNAENLNANDPRLTKLLEEIDVRQREKAELAKKAEAEKAKRAEYEQYIKEGTLAMRNGDFGHARINFDNAASLYPNEKEPPSKIAELERLELAAEEASRNSKYAEFIAEADKAFNTKDYGVALAQYESALELKPNEPYPQERIIKLEQLIKEAEAKAIQAEKDSHRHVVEESYDEGRSKVTIRRVTVNGKEEVYKRVVHSWGGKYYFLDDKPITELVWNRETVK